MTDPLVLSVINDLPEKVSRSLVTGCRVFSEEDLQAEVLRAYLSREIKGKTIVEAYYR